MKNAFNNNSFLLKSMCGAILDKIFNFSRAFLQMPSMLALKVNL